MPKGILVQMRLNQLDGYKVIVSDAIDDALAVDDQALRSLKRKLDSADSGNFGGKIRYFAWLSQDELNALQEAVSGRFGEMVSLEHLTARPPAMLAGEEEES